MLLLTTRTVSLDITHPLNVFGIPGPMHRDLRGALSISRRSSVVSSTAAAPMFSSRRCTWVVPGMGTIPGFDHSQIAGRKVRSDVAFSCAGPEAAVRTSLSSGRIPLLRRQEDRLISDRHRAACQRGLGVGQISLEFIGLRIRVVGVRANAIAA